MRKKKPLVIDLFCGVGGLSFGFKQAGFKIVAGFDSDRIHVETHRKNFPTSVSVCADIRHLTGEKIRLLSRLQATTVIDVVVGGPPCQGFSMIGKRDMADSRNLLLAEFGRIISELRPRYFVLENVAGLMYGGARNILAQFLKQVRGAGYRWVSPIRIVDAAEFGVPQRRKRVFVLGYRKGQQKPRYPRPLSRRVSTDEAIGDLKVLGKKTTLFSMDAYCGKLGHPSPYASKLRNRTTQALTGCLRARHEVNVIRRFRGTKPGEVEPISRFVRLKKNTVSATLRAGTASEYGGFTAARPIHPTQPRCITVREAARIHSFPDWFEFHPTQWHGFRQVGNSVPPLLAKAIARKVYAVCT